MTIQNILIVSTTGMGDCLWGTPGIRELKNTYPDAKIDLIVKKDWFIPRLQWVVKEVPQ